MTNQGGKDIKLTRRWTRQATFLSGFILSVFSLASIARADSVGQAQVTKFFAPETIQMLLNRIGTPSAGIQNGDTLTYVIESIPVNDGGSQGVNGYITDYVPQGLEVVGASFVNKVPDPTKPGGFDYIDKPLNSAGLMGAGVGKRGAIFAGLLPYADGALSEGSQDTGIFYSTDPRTQRLTIPHIIAAGCSGAKFAPGTYNVFNDWDYAQFAAFGAKAGRCVPALTSLATFLAAPRSGSGTQPLINIGTPLLPLYAGLGSPVAGPQTYFTNDYNSHLLGPFIPPVTYLPTDFYTQGPWNRIAYQGSAMGGSGPVTPAFFVPGFPPVSTAVPTSMGVHLNPAGGVLPWTGLTRVNAVRWAFGQRVVGTLERAKISFKVRDINAFTTLAMSQNHSAVFGGDITAPAAGKDLTYKYLAPTQSISDARLMLIKQIVAVGAPAVPPATGITWTPSDGATVAPGQYVKYRITYLNATSTSLTGFSLNDVIDPLNMVVPLPVASYATTGSPYLAIPVATLNGVAWNPVLPQSTLAPGAGGTVDLVAQMSLAAGVGSVATNTAHAHTMVPLIDAYAYAPSNIATSAPPSLVNSKSVSPSAATPGQLVKYSIVVSNIGGPLNTPLVAGKNGAAPQAPYVPNALVVGDALDPNLTYTSTTSIALRDRTTGNIYPYAPLDPYTLPVAPVPPANTVYWGINGYPASYPLPPLLAAPNYLRNVDFLIDFYATVNPLAAPGTYYNTVESYGNEPIKAKNLSWITNGLAPVTVSGAAGFANLSFNKTATDINGVPLHPGDDIRYDMSVTNTAPLAPAVGVAATNVRISDAIPGASQFVVGSAIPPVGCTTAYSNNGGFSYLYVPIAGLIDPYVTNIQFTCPTLAVGATALGSFNARTLATLPDGATISNQATVDAYSGITPFQILSDDPATPATPDATISTISAPASFVTSSKTVSGQTGTTAAPGTVLTYSINVFNDGYTASNISVTDQVDLNVFGPVSLGALPPNWSATGPDAAGNITWRTASMATGSSAVLTFTATVKAGIADGTALNNSAVISSDQSTPFTANAPGLTTPQTLVSGKVFKDRNGNGVKNGAGDSGIANVSVALRAPGSGFDTVSVLTDPYGNYILQAPAPGNWDVLVTDTGGVLAGHTLTTSNPLNVTLSNGVTLANQHFGYQPPASPATITGTIYNDLNGDGTRQAPGEGGIAGVTMQLKNAAGTVVGTATTDASGLYGFGSLASGNYTLEVTDTAGFLSNDYQTTLPATPIPFTVAAGTTTTSDIGYQIGSRIGDLVFADTNNNGIFDIGETGIPGVTLDLKQGAVVIASTTTDINGAYLFQGVAPGAYQVMITDTAGKLTGFLPTTAVTSPYAVTASSGVDTLTADFGYNAAPGFVVSKTVDKGSAGFNAAVQYTITIDNYGGAAQNFVVRDMLPSTSAVLPYNISASNFLYLSTDSVTMNGVPFTIPNQPLSLSNQPTWSGFTMPAASTLTIVFTAFTGANEGLHYNGVHTEYNNNVGGLPPAIANDYPNLALVTISSAGTVSKQVTAINGVPWAGPGNPVVAAGDVITYRVTLANTPAAVSQSVVDIYEQMPAGFTYQPGSSVLTAPVNPPLAAPVPTQIGQQLIWTFVGPLYPATNGGVPLGYPSTVTLDFNLIVPLGVIGTFTDLAQMNIMLNGLPPVVPLSSGNTAPVTVDISPPSITGTVFEDINFGGGAGRDKVTSNGVGIAGARVELYDSLGNFVSFATTGAGGTYQFSGLANGAYTVRVASNGVTGVRSTRAGGAACTTCIPTQTYRTNAVSGMAVPVTDHVGGEKPSLADAADNTTLATLASLTTATTTAQSITTVTKGAAPVTGVDFGFNFDTIVSTRNAGQGSVRQFITNANMLGGEATLAQQGLSVARETSVFMIPNGLANPGQNTGYINQITATGANAGAAVVTLATLLPAITGANTSLDATTQTLRVGDTNPGTVGTGGTVGVSAIPLAPFNRPEIVIAAAATQLNASGAGVTIQGLAVSNGGILVAGANSQVSDCLTGMDANGVVTTIYGLTYGITAGAGTGILINHNYVKVNNSGIRGNSPGANLTIEYNEVDSIDGTPGGGHTNTFDGILIINTGTNVIIRYNLVKNQRGGALEFGFGAGAVTATALDNSLLTSGWTSPILASTEGMGIAAYSLAAGSAITFQQNIVSGNSGPGIAVIPGALAPTASGITITRNSIYGNGTIGIDLNPTVSDPNTYVPQGVTINDLNDADIGPNGLLNFPVLESAKLSGGNLVLTGWASPGATIELFISDADLTGFGEGKTYLTTLTEGSVVAPIDTYATASLYGPAAINGILQGTDNTNRFKFTIPAPAGVTGGSVLSATATVLGSTSEFSGNIVVSGQPSLLILKTVNTVSDPVNGTTNPFNIPGSVVQYNLIVTNSGAGSPDVDSVALVDPIPVNTAMYFDPYAATFTDGAVASGLTCTFASLASTTDCIDFSNTTAPYTWTYIPSPTAGIDTNVTAIRIKPAGTMSPASGGNNPSFTASFKVQVK